MSQRDIRQTYTCVIEAVSAGDDTRLDDLICEDLIDHNPGPGQPPGRDGFTYWAASARAAFPDLTGVVEDTVVEGDTVAARVTWRGTHHGEFLGVPATGRTVEFAAFHLVRFRAGRAAEWWGTADLLGAAGQVGATITPQRQDRQVHTPQAPRRTT
jgi:steroid delta-isomerase-like uncharacterized protein